MLETRLGGSLTCAACGSDRARETLELGNLPFWTGIVPRGVAFRAPSAPARLVQCADCALVQQPPDPVVRGVLDVLYATPELSNPSAAAGSAGWGEEVARGFRRATQGVTPRRVLEIGCGPGHLLEDWRKRGAEVVVGFEPSGARETTTPSGALIVPAYFTAERALEYAPAFDVVYSFGVVEHIPDLARHLDSIAQVLSEGGHFFAEVPNAAASLEDGDLGLFIHQHLNYFTPETLAAALSRAGLDVVACEHDRMEIVVHAVKRGRGATHLAARPVSLREYARSARSRVDRVARGLSRPGSHAFYGACAGLANLNAWLPETARDRFAVFDSDPAKRGRRVSGVNVDVGAPTEMADISPTDVWIAPYAFQDAIERSLATLTKAAVHRVYDATTYRESEGRRR